GDLKAAAVALAAQLGISHRIIFAGFRTDVPEILHGIDIYCLPSLWEGLPIGMLEAMAMGNPVVTTSVDGAKEVIADGINGMLVPPRSPDRLAEALTALGSDHLLREVLGKRAFETVSGSFNVEKMSRQLEQVYASFIDDKEQI